MSWINKRLTYANVMSSLAVFLVLAGGSAFAASQLGKNSVGAPQLKKNAVTTAKIKKNAITTAKIKANAIATAKIKNGAITGAKIENGAITGAKIDAASLGTVPNATTAANLSGQTPFFVRLGFGQTQVLATHGAVSLTAECSRSGGEDIARISFATTVNGAVASADDDYNGTGPADFLNVDTPLGDRELESESTTEGQTHVDADIDSGFVMGPEGKMLAVNSEAIALGLNYVQPGCVFAGVINAVG